MIPKHKQEAISKRLMDTFGFNETVGDIVFRVAFAPEGHDSDYLLSLLEKPADSIEHRTGKILLEELT